MDVFTMVAIIVVASCAAGMYKDHVKSKRAREEGEASESVELELDELRQRIEVLEKIVTDERYHLEKEINNLERQA